MIAYLIDAELRTINEIAFDGKEQTIRCLLDCDQVAFEQWPIGGSHTIGSSIVTRMYFDSKAAGNSDLYGFQVPETCGIINHGVCLQVTFDTRSRMFVDRKLEIATMKRTYRIYEPEVGIRDQLQWR